MLATVKLCVSQSKCLCTVALVSHLVLKMCLWKWISQRILIIISINLNANQLHRFNDLQALIRWKASVPLLFLSIFLLNFNLQLTILLNSVGSSKPTNWWTVFVCAELSTIRSSPAIQTSFTINTPWERSRFPFVYSIFGSSFLMRDVEREKEIPIPIGISAAKTVNKL